MAAAGLSSVQAQNVNILLGECKRLNAPQVCWQAIIYAATYESNIGASSDTYTPNSVGYVGVLQGSAASWDPHDTVGMADAFLQGGKGFQSGGAINLARQGVTNPIEIAVRVEVPSIWPDNAYAKEVGYPGDAAALAQVNAIVSAYGGGAIPGGTAGLGGTGTAANGSPQSTYTFQVGSSDNPDEDNWTAINRLAQEVNWYLFSDAETVFYVDGADLIAQSPGSNAYVDRVKNADRIAHFQATYDNPLALDTPIPTPNGWTTMGELEPGDTVFGADGRRATVRGVSPVFYDRTCYRVRFSDGTAIVADESHPWETVSLRKDAKADMQVAHQRYRGVRTTGEIRETLRVDWTRQSQWNHRVRVAEPLELPENDLPIDPYLFGYWLGDGTVGQATISVGTPDVPSLLREVEGAGYEHFAREKPATGFATQSYWRVTPRLRTAPRSTVCSVGGCDAPVRVLSRGLCGRCYGRLRYQGCLPEGRPQDNMTARLREAGVLDGKHIPQCYLRASMKQRLALLQGLMDSDGTVDRACCLCLADKRLATDALELIRSLGFRPNWTEKPPRGRSSRQYSIAFASRPHLNPFRLPRKADRYAARVAGKASRGSAKYRTVVAVEPVASVPVRCIAVDTKDHLFLAGEGMCPTHNTAYQYVSTHKRKSKVQRKTRLTQVTSPTQFQLSLICGVDEFRAGDLIVLSGFGPANGRWIIGDARRSVFNVYTELRLVPPIMPLAEAQVAGTTGKSSGATSTSTSGAGVLSGSARDKVVQVAKKAIARQASQHAYQYAEVRPYPGSLFGPAPIITDCSGFSILCYKDAGQSDPNGTNFDGSGNTDSLIARGTPVSSPQPADLVFYPGHVAVFLGGGQIANMGSPGEPVQESIGAPHGGNIIGIRSYL